MKRTWTDQQLASLKEKYPVCTPEELMTIFPDKTKKAIASKAKVLDLKKQNFTYDGKTYQEEVAYGFVDFIQINSNNDPEPVFLKAKKNGCPSKLRLYISPRSTVYIVP